MDGLGELAKLRDEIARLEVERSRTEARRDEVLRSCAGRFSYRRLAVAAGLSPAPLSMASQMRS